MLYSEFVDGTGCRENEYNFKVYKDLEVMYMNTGMSKQEIYEYGKKLVDNSDTPEQIALKERIRQEIAGHKSQIESYKKDLEFQKQMFECDGNKDRRKTMQYTRQAIRKERQMIQALKWVLGM